MKIISFADLVTADIVIDAIYESSHDGQLRGEPVSKLLPGLGNMGGFRMSGSGVDKRLVALFTTGEDKDWPDALDTNTGKFEYFGDNKKPGHEIHDTKPGGNRVLKRAFDLVHLSNGSRELIPPFLIFKKQPTERGARSVQFKGVAVPGYPGMSATDDLVAVWKTTDGQRFQNYRAVFTILDIAVVSREWINDILAGVTNSQYAPPVWRDWIEKGKYTPLTSEPTTTIRTEAEQLPDTPIKSQILQAVWQHFDHSDKNEKTRRAHIFERFAARIFQMMDQRVIIDEITRGVVDGGRDAVGRYLLGLPDDPVYAEFALEAKCYSPGIGGTKLNTVGVKETSRLISRIRHRQFGVLVTTSAVSRQAYNEVRDDRHPIILISGRDIAELLIKTGFNTAESVQSFLTAEFSGEVTHE